MAEQYLVILKEPVDGYEIGNYDVSKQYKAVLLSEAPTITSDANLASFEGADPFVQALDHDADEDTISDLRVSFNRSDVRVVIWVKDESVPMAEVYAAFVKPDDILDLSGIISEEVP